MNAHNPGLNSPTPWRDTGRFDGFHDANGRRVTVWGFPIAHGQKTPNSEANAAYIVTAVNSHADLVAALQAIVDLDDGDKPDLWHFEKEFANARAALAKAGV